MKHLLAATACILTLAATACAQTTTNAALRQDSVVVTNEQDLVGIEFAKTNHLERVYAPGENTWIDGAGNKYTSFAVRTVTFSEDFADYSSGKPAESSYQLAYNQQISTGPYNNYWRFLWNEGGVTIARRVMYTYNNWGATTNELVLETSDGGAGTAFVSPVYFVTNLVESLTGKLPLTGGVLTGDLEMRYPAAFKFIDALGNTYPASINGELIATATEVATKPSYQEATNIVRTVEGWLTYTNLTGSVTITNQFEAPIAISGTGAVSVAFSEMRTPYPLYFTAQGFTSMTLPAGTYLVGGGMWQTNRVNHFIVWQYSTNLYINPVITSEIVP